MMTRHIGKVAHWNPGTRMGSLVVCDDRFVFLNFQRPQDPQVLHALAVFTPPFPVDCSRSGLIVKFDWNGSSAWAWNLTL
jgi:hypothetical protein